MSIDPNNSTNNSTTAPPQTTPTPNGNVVTFIPPINYNGYIYTITYPFQITTVNIGSNTEVDQEPKKKEKSEGCRCIKCETFNEYAEPNQEDGSFLCYGCRKGF